LKKVRNKTLFLLCALVQYRPTCSFNIVCLAVHLHHICVRNVERIALILWMRERAASAIKCSKSYTQVNSAIPFDTVVFFVKDVAVYNHWSTSSSNLWLWSSDIVYSIAAVIYIASL